MDIRGGKITIGELLDNPKSSAILKKRLPKVANHPMIGLARRLTMEEVLRETRGAVPQKIIQTIVKEIEEA